MTEELKPWPCQFCGGPAEIKEPGHEVVDGRGWFVSCAHRAGPIHNAPTRECVAYAYGSTREEAIAAWNARPSPPPPMPENGLRDAAEPFLKIEDALIGDRDRLGLIPLADDECSLDECFSLTVGDFRRLGQALASTGEGGGEIKRTMTINLTEEEMAVLEKLAAEKDLSPPSIFRSALRVYQLFALPDDHPERLRRAAPDDRLFPTTLAEEGAEEPGAKEAFEALDIADRLIERAYGDDVPHDWNEAYRAVAKARALPRPPSSKAVEPGACFACEGFPVAPNDPCGLCGRSSEGEG